jgi:cellobiose transport system substrate-binding protein
MRDVAMLTRPGRLARPTRLVRVGVPVLTLALLAAACGDGEATGTASEAAGGDEVTGEAPPLDIEPGDTISIWTFGATGLEPKMEAWAEENEVTLDIKTGDFDAHHEQLQTALVSGSVPDIAVVEIGFSSLFKSVPEQFVDLRTYGAGDLEGDYLDWRWANGVAADGSVIGIPTDVGGMALAYRTDLFEEAGLPTDPDEVAGLWSSWDEFLEVGEQYTADTGEAFLDDSGVLFETVVRQGDQMFYDEDGGLVYADNPQVATAWDVASRAAESEGLSADLGAFSPEWNTGMAQGAYAVQLAPSWMLAYIQGQAPDTAGLWNVTTLPEGGGNWGGSQLTIPADAAHPAAAYDLITTVLSPEAQFEVFTENGNFPTTPELYEAPEMQEYTSEFFSGAATGQIYTASVLELEPVFEGEDQRAIMREFGSGIDRVEKGQQSADEAWDEVLATVQRDIG